MFAKTVALFGFVSSVALVGCASAATEQTASSDSHVETSDGAFTPGKYVGNGVVFMIYGECSGENFLGEAAVGAIENNFIMAPEGDLCGRYRLRSPAEGTIEVFWQRDESAHIGEEASAACSSMNGTYLMTEAGTPESAPGAYVNRDGVELDIASACGAAVSLKDNTGTLIASGTRGTSALQTEEGDVCGAYSYKAQADGSLRVKWEKDPSAHLDAESTTGCASLEGTYRTR